MELERQIEATNAAREETIEARVETTEARTAERRERSRVIAKQSRELTASGDAGTGLALGLAAIKKAEGWLPTAEAEQSVHLALENLHEELLLRGHEGWVWAAVFSPDGARIVSGSGDATVRVWDASSGEELLVLRGHENSVFAAELSPDGARLVSGSGDATVRVWDAASGEELLALRGHEGDVWAANFSTDGARLVSGSSDNTVRVWDAASGEELLVLHGHEGVVFAAAFSPDGARIMSGSSDGTVRVWDAASGRELLVLRGHEGSVEAAAFSPDGANLVSGSVDGTVRVWDAASGEELLVLRGHEAAVYAVEFSADAARIVSGSADDTVRVWDAASGTELLVLRGHQADVDDVAFSPDGARIVSGSDDTTARVWRLRPVLKATTYRSGILERGLEPSPDGDKGEAGRGNLLPRALAALSADGAAVGRVSNTGAILWSAPEAPVAREATSWRPLAVNAINERLRAVDTWGELLTLNPRDVIRTSLDLRGARLVGAAFAQDGNGLVALTSNGDILRIATPEDTVTKVVRIAAGDPVARAAVALGSQGWSSVLIALDDGRAFGPEGDLVGAQRGPQGRALDANADQGRVATVVATRGGDRVMVWQATNGKVIADLPIPLDDGQVLDAVISPSGGRSLSVGSNGPMRLWELSDATAPIAIFGKTGDGFTGAAFAPDGRRVAAAQTNGDVKVWPIFASREELIEFAKAVSPRELTFAQQCQYQLVDEAECLEHRELAPVGQENEAFDWRP